MIVTADPQGEFNSTTQILKYSALAREITVPRPPPPSRKTPPDEAAETEQQQPENDEDDNAVPVDSELFKYLFAQLQEAQVRYRRAEKRAKEMEERCRGAERRRKEAEERCREADEHANQIEQQVREEISAEFEERAKILKTVYLAKMVEEEEAGRQFIDGKLELAMRGTKMDVFEDHDEARSTSAAHERDSDGEGEDEEVRKRMEELERENYELRREMLKMKRELLAKSPSKSVKPTAATPVQTPSRSTRSVQAKLVVRQQIKTPRSVIGRKGGGMERNVLGKRGAAVEDAENQEPAQLGRVISGRSRGS